MSEVRLPRQARQQLAAAEQIEQSIASSLAAANGIVPIEVAVAAQAAVGQISEPSLAPAEVSPPPQVEARAAEDFEQKYRTLTGKYNAEVPRLQQQIQNAERERDGTSSRLTQLETELRQLRDKPQAQVVDPKDAESFGADLVEMVQRQASVEIARAISATQSATNSRLEKLEAAVTGVSHQSAVSAEQAFFASLEAAVPDLQAVNGSDAFLMWLGEADPVYGEPRQNALNRARESLNAQRAAAVFNAFKQTVAKPAPVPANDLQNQVAPARTGATQVVTPQGRVVVSARSITAYYEDVRRGVYRGREAESQRVEAEINLALAEGRVA